MTHNADYRARRREFKRRFLEAVAITASEGMNWGVTQEDQDELDLSEETIEAVIGEVGNEIQRRADRLAVPGTDGR
jgi:hypothetical protein